MCIRDSVEAFHRLPERGRPEVPVVGDPGDGWVIQQPRHRGGMGGPGRNGVGREIRSRGQGQAALGEQSTLSREDVVQDVQGAPPLARRRRSPVGDCGDDVAERCQGGSVRCHGGCRHDAHA